MLRDADPFIYAFAELAERNSYRYGGLLFNLPDNVYNFEGEPDHAPLVACLRDSDLILRTTRPTVPYWDKDSRHDFGGRSNTAIEQDLAGCDASFFYYCNREKVSFAQGVVAQLGGPKSTYAHLSFQQHGGARRHHSERSLVGFITYSPQVSDTFNVPVANVFSLDGTSTLLWAYALTGELAGTLAGVIAGRKKRLLIAEFQVRLPDQRRILDLSELEFPSCKPTVDLLI